ncbi:MAG TPA: hypothetical protein PKM73_10660 [Verrucomicrobiota bacterium]|nr:hypothetical protein [Verrucomicrobiota bacterium]HNU52156.1 hypothetical protein [Verrucomicrobiota bacterium]
MGSRTWFSLKRASLPVALGIAIGAGSQPLKGAAVPDFSLVGFAALDGFSTNGTLLAGGTTGGAAGLRVQVSTLADLVQHLESDAPRVIELTQDIDMAPLANHQGGFPTDYPVGEIRVHSDKTLCSKHGATLRRGTLRLGKGPTGRHNIIIRNLRFRDLWVPDPTGKYDEYGWDYIGLEAGSHHVWIDHCDFERAYDGMIDVKGGADYVTVSWCVFRDQKKCNLVGASDNSGATDRGHLNITLHHNWYQDVAERTPRMRFGNAHVFNLYCVNLGGKGIQSTVDAATLVEAAFFETPKTGSYPTLEANGGPAGIVKVVGSRIVNAPGVNVAFREFGAREFRFNPPFATPEPPYPYTAHPVDEVPGVVTRWAGPGKIGFELWRLEHFTPDQLRETDLSGPGASPAGDGVPNLLKYAFGLGPFEQAVSPWITLRLDEGRGMLAYARPASATDVSYRVEVSQDLEAWTESGIHHAATGTNASGLQTWEARQTTPPTARFFFRMRIGFSGPADSGSP